MPVTLAVPFRDHKSPPPLPSTHPATSPPPLPSMRVPKGTIAHDGDGERELSLQEAVLKARRESEELEWQAQVDRAKALTRAEASAPRSEAEEWSVLRARNASLPVEMPPRPQRRKPPRPMPSSARVALAKPAQAPQARVNEREAEEREWRELRARARLAEEREWEELIARARTAAARPVQRTARPRLAVVAWP